MTETRPPWWATVDRHARAVGVNPELLARIAGSESAFQNVDVRIRDEAGRPTSDATGPFQFISSTWDELARRYPDLDLAGHRRDVEAQARAIGPFTAEQITVMRRALRRDPTGPEVYLAHFLGPGDAPHVILANPDTPVRTLINPASFQANRVLFEDARYGGDMTAGQLQAWARQRIGDVSIHPNQPPQGAIDPEAEAELRETLVEDRVDQALGTIDRVEPLVYPDGSTALSRIALGPGLRDDGRRLSLDDLDVQRPLTRQETRDLERRDRPAVNLIDGVALAGRQEWSLVWQLQGRPEFIPDAGFAPDQALLREVSQDIPTEHLGYLDGSRSEGELRWRADQLRADLDRERRLAAMGVTGAALRIGAALTDPVGIVAGALTGGIGTAARLTRLQRIARSALAAGAANAAVEALIVDEKPVSDGMSLLYAAAGGMVAGAVFGSFGRARGAEDLAGRIEQHGRALERSVEDQVAGRGSTAGAVEISVREALRHDTFDLVRDLTDDVAPRTAFGRLRFDSVGSLKSSRNPLSRALGGNLAEDAVGNRNRDVATAIGASERQALLQRRMEASWRRVADPAFLDWARERNLNWFQRQRQRGAFNDEVSVFIRNVDPTRSFDPNVARAGEHWRTLARQMGELASDPGAPLGQRLRPVRGFEGFTPDPNYLPRLFDHRRINDLLLRYGDKELRRLIGGAIRAAQPEIEDAVANRIARGYLRAVRSHGAGQDPGAFRALTGEDADAFRQMLLAADVSEADINRLIRHLDTRRPEDSGAAPRGRRRLFMDENFTTPLRRTDGLGEESVRITDLLNNDADALFEAYNRQMSGQIALAQVRVKNPNWTGPDDPAPEYLIDGITAQSEFETLLNQLKGVGDEIGQDPGDLQSDLANLRFLHRMIAGIPDPADIGRWGQIARMVRDYNFTRVMNQVGFAQIAEIGNIIGQLGWRAAVHSMPSLRSFIRAAKTGELQDDLMREIEHVWAPGTERLRGTVSNRWDDFGSPVTFQGQSRALHAVDQVLARGKRITADISGMAPVNAFIQRWAASGIVGAFADMASGLAAVNRARMRTLGLSDAMLDRVLAQARRHFTHDRGELTGRTVTGMHLDRWDDVEARAAFEAAVFRLGRRIIQENDIGMMHRWMSQPMVRLLTQFRAFMLGSWSKQFLHNIHMRDTAAFSAFTTSMVIAGLVYVAQTHAQAIGRSDRQDFLDWRLTEDAIARAAFQRAGFSALFPMFVDSAAPMLGHDPLFDFRTTGQPSDIVFGNPTTGLMNDVITATGGLAEAAREGRRPSQAEMRSLQRVLPFQNFLPFAQLYAASIGDLPERAPRD